MERLQPVVFNDAWGSHVALASLTGRSIPSREPESELWMGAHEDGPATLVDCGGITLDQFIAQDPEGLLGAENVATFGPRLPFLLKVLAPGRAISIQVHPTAEQAVAERGRSGDAVYVDDWAKPELLLAIAPFEVFVGMRTFEEITDLIDSLRVETLVKAAAVARDEADPIHALLSAILATAPADVPELTRRVVAACVRMESGGGELGEAAAAVVRVAEDHPDDIGLAVLLLMNHRTLQPGEFIDVAAGVLHSYVGGLGIEVLANSDNVVRAGLTSKTVNIPELLRIVDTTADGVPGSARRVSDRVEVFDSAADRFGLHRIDASAGECVLGGPGPRIAFCLRGSVELQVAGQPPLHLADAESAFLSAGDGDLTVRGTGELYVAGVPTA